MLVKNTTRITPLRLPSSLHHLHCHIFKPNFTGRSIMSVPRKRHKFDVTRAEFDARESAPSFAVPNLKISNHSIKVPLDYTGELPGTIDVFYRVVVHRSKSSERLPYLLYLNGGPGYETPRPLDASGWIKTATNYFRVVLMDQRGTGNSTCITAENLVVRGSPQEQAKYLKCFRADSIVKDCEAIRSQLLDFQQWSILGQSFGGFCCTTYLSFSPQSLSEVMITGGLPPRIGSQCSAQEVYRRTFRRVMKQNEKFYTRFPQAKEYARNIVLHLASLPKSCTTTPAGNTLSPRSFQLLGLQFMGFSYGFERLYYMLESAMDQSTGTLSHKFLKDFDSTMSWDTNPLYAVLHEAIYCQGGTASNWGAHTIRENEFKDEFDAVRAANCGDTVLFTGEMVFPWMFDEFKELRKIKEAAEIIAADSDWSVLYNEAQLAKNTVPVAAASYFDDIFVDFNLAQETAGKINGIRQHITNEYLHDGLKEAGAALVEKLLNMARDGVLLR